MSKKHLDLNGKTILVTGSPGFIGANLVLRLIKEMSTGIVVSFDNMNDYYDPSLKEYRLKHIEEEAKKHSVKHCFVKGNIADKNLVDEVFANFSPDFVVNLAAQAGVRYSVTNPAAYIESNIIGFYNILEACRHSYDNDSTGVSHLVYASSSSVYGGNKKIPFCVEDPVDHPVSLYAATKKSDELLAYSYSKLYNIPSTGLRFFTVYGPAGRPDMAYYSFTEKLRNNKTIDIFNYGECKRDFTYIDDIIEGIIRVMQGAPSTEYENENDNPPYAIYNIGGGKPENLMDFVTILCEELKNADILPEDFLVEEHINLLPMQQGDVPITYADSSALEKDYNFIPRVSLRDGLKEFAKWYRNYIYS